MIVLMMHMILSYLLVLLSLNDPKEYFQIFQSSFIDHLNVAVTPTTVQPGLRARATLRAS